MSTEKKFLRHHVHSVNSQRDGTLKIKDLVKDANDAGEAFAICDHGSIGGWLETIKECEKVGLKPILGTELYINKKRELLFETLAKIKQTKENDEKEETKELSKIRDDIKKSNHIVLIAKNQTGFYNIIKINNISYENFYSKPLSTYKDIFKHKDGIIITTACMGGSLGQYITQKQFDDADEFIKLFKEEFGDDFYIEVQANNMDIQRELNTSLIELAKKHNVKICIGMDSHYLHKEDADTHQDMLLLQNKQTREDLDKIDLKITYENKKGEVKTKKIDGNKEFKKDGPLAKDIKVGDKIGPFIITKIEEENRAWKFSSDLLYYKSEKETKSDIKKFHKELIPYINEIIETNKEIYNKIEVVELDSKIKLPVTDNGREKLIELVKTGLKEKGLVKREYIDRIKYELETIENFNFIDYFLILHDIMEFAKSNEIPIGAGRGSAASSLVAYVLGIHRIDPLDEKFGDMEFSRFLVPYEDLNFIILEDENGEKKEYRSSQLVDIIRNGKQISILAREIKEGDEING